VVNFPNEEAFHYGEKISVVSNERSKLDKWSNLHNFANERKVDDTCLLLNCIVGERHHELKCSVPLVITGSVMTKVQFKFSFTYNFDN
jgi:hypothetical protein